VSVSFLTASARSPDRIPGLDACVASSRLASRPVTADRADVISTADGAEATVPQPRSKDFPTVVSSSSERSESTLRWMSGDGLT
jgi:hypothetical protein